MPIYEYLCKKCGKFEMMRKITDGTLKHCPTCSGKVTKLISHTSFQLKGSGWYLTDYARKGDGAKKEEAGGEKKEETKSGTASSEAKPGTTSSESKGTSAKNQSGEKSAE